MSCEGSVYMTSAQYKVHRTIHFEVAISVLEIHVKFTSVMDNGNVQEQKQLVSRTYP